MHFVYILQSKEGRFYIGSTRDLEYRLIQHNDKTIESWTKRFSDWKIVYTEQYATITDARKRENIIKSYKGGNSWKKLQKNFKTYI